MRSNGITLEHPAFRSFVQESTDLFLESVSNYFLQYLRYLRIHVRMNALKDLSAPEYEKMM